MRLSTGTIRTALKVAFYCGLSKQGGVAMGTMRDDVVAMEILGKVIVEYLEPQCLRIDVEKYLALEFTGG